MEIESKRSENDKDSATETGEKPPVVPPSKTITKEENAKEANSGAKASSAPAISSDEKDIDDDDVREFAAHKFSVAEDTKLTDSSDDPKPDPPAPVLSLPSSEAKTKTAETEGLVKKPSVEAEVLAKKPAAEAEALAKKPAAEAEALAKKPSVEAEALAKKPSVEAEALAKKPSVEAEALAKKPAAEAEGLAKKPAAEAEALAKKLSVEAEALATKPSVEAEALAKKPSVEAEALAKKPSEAEVLAKKPSVEAEALAKKPSEAEVLAKKPAAQAEVLAKKPAAQAEVLAKKPSVEAEVLAKTQPPASGKLAALLGEGDEASEKRKLLRDQHRITLSQMMRAPTPPEEELTRSVDVSAKTTPPKPPTVPIVLPAARSAPAPDSSARPSVPPLPTAGMRATGSHNSQAPLRSDWRRQEFGGSPPTPFHEFVARNQMRLTIVSLILFVIILGVCLTRGYDLDKSINLVQKQYEQKDYDNALATVMQVLEKHPESAVAHYWKGRLAVKANRFEEAATEMEKACAGAPFNNDYLVYEAKAFASTGRGKDAINVYTKLLSVPSFHTGYTFTNRAFAELMALQYNEAMDDFNQAIALEPSKREYYANRALAYSIMNNPKKSIDEWGQLIKKNPKDADAYAQRGQVEFQSGQLAAAQKDLAASIAIKPTTTAYYCKGIIDRAQKHPLLALANFDKALKLEPLNANALKESALAYIDLGDYNNALAKLNKIGSIGQTAVVPDYFRVKATAEMKLGHYAQAAADLEKIIAEKPTDKAARLDHAQCAEKLRDFGKASEDYTALIDTDPKNVSLYVDRGRVNSLEKKYDLSANDFAQALKLNANYVLAYVYRGLDSGERGSYGEALVDLTHALKLQPGNKIATEGYAKYSKLKASHEGAAPRTALNSDSGTSGAKPASSGNDGIQRLAKAVVKNPNDASARRTLAYALFADEQFSAAADQFDALSALSKLTQGDYEKYVDALMSAGRDREACNVMEVRLVSNRWDVESRIRLANLYAKLNMKDKARQTCRAGMKDYTSINDFKRLKETLEGVDAVAGQQGKPGSSVDYQHVGG